MWRWYVEVGFLVLLCFGAGAAVAAVVLARVLPGPTAQDAVEREPALPGGSS